MKTHDISPWLLRGLYLFGLALVVTAAVDLLTTAWPPRPTDMSWRYGFLGLGAGYLQTPTLGLLLVIGSAALQGHVTVMRAMGIVCLALALVILAVIGVFALDVLQMRQLRAEEVQAGILAGAIFQELKYVMAAGVLGLTGWGTLQSAKSLARSGGRGSTPGILSSAG